ncbi:MAG: hypothetical protein KDA42_06220, partial [Planctomycetales bacterium]|nr:hypothetical protein [Planctomycetales bacterium]
KPGPVKPRKELLAGWKQPDATFVMTGEMHGYIEPCGCTSGQSGGLARRADLIRRIRGKGWPLTAVDLGGTMRRSRRQSQIKFETLLAGLRDMEYAVLGLGPEELRFGPEYLLTQNVAESTEDTRGLPFVAANVVLFEVPGLEGGPLELRIIEAGKVKIGVTAVVGNSLKEKAIVQQGSRDLVITDPLEALAAVVPKLEAEQPDVLLLLAHGSAEETREYATKFPQFDLILSAGGPEDPDDRPVWVNDGRTLLVTVGHKGKYAGVVGFYADGDSGKKNAGGNSAAPTLPDAAEKPGAAAAEKPAPSDPSAGPKQSRFRFELVELDQLRFDESLVMVEHMRRYQQRLKAEKIVSQMAPIDHSSGAEFVGAERCGECHTKAFAKWKSTPHAKAFESLKHAREGAKDYGITRIYDPECLSCHVTGWHPQQVIPYSSGFINEEFARTEDEHRRAMTLQGNQCENCHGPGSKHIQLIEDGETEMARALVRVTLERARKSLCYECHDLDNSPEFKFKTYWPEVAHEGKD